MRNLPYKENKLFIDVGIHKIQYTYYCVPICVQFF